MTAPEPVLPAPFIKTSACEASAETRYPALMLLTVTSIVPIAKAKVEKAKRLGVVQLQPVRCFGVQNMDRILGLIERSENTPTDSKLRKIEKDIG